MQSLEWHGQSLLAKWFAVVTTLAVAMLALLAGAALLGAEHALIEYDMQAPRSFQWASSLGLFSIVIAWVLHMLSMLVLLGYSHKENRVFASFVMTGTALLYLLFVCNTSLSALFPPGMKSMM